MSTRAAIIIPARNEAPRIGRLVRELRETTDAIFGIIIVCNGCSDETALAARSAAGDDRRFVILEIEAASKTGAIRAGEAVLDAAPREIVRIFLDADVGVTAEAVDDLARLVWHPQARAGSLRLRVRTDHCSRIARLAAEGWKRTPYFRSAPLQCVIAVSSLGRQRWHDLPDVIGADMFIASRFQPDEIVVSSHESVIDWPRSAAGVLRTYIRWRQGTIEAARHGTIPRKSPAPALGNRMPCDVVHGAFQALSRAALLLGYRPRSWYSAR